MASYTTQLNNLKNAQKKAAVADLENTRNTTLSNLQAEEAKINPTYAEKRTQASNASKVNARNFQEYLANTGRANSGIGAQYEMGRQNSLNRDINALNTQQAADIADIARRRTDANNAYNTGLAGANAQVEANYIQNLLNQQQQQWENNMALKQFNESVRQFNLTRKDNLRGFSSGGRRSSSGGSSRRSGRSSGSKGVVITDGTKKLTNEQVNTIKNLVNVGKTFGSAASKLTKKATSGPIANSLKKTISNITKKSKTTNKNDYKISSVSSPASFSSKNAKNWYSKNASKLKSKSALDSAIANGLKSGSITKADANKIYKVYGF